MPVTRRTFLTMLSASSLLAGCGGTTQIPSGQPSGSSLVLPTAVSTSVTAAPDPAPTEPAKPALQIGTNKGDLAADIEFVHYENDTVVRLSDFLGKAVFLNFWATWCPPCREEMPEIEKVYKRYRDKNVAILGVSVGEPKDTLDRFFQKNTYSWTFLLDERNRAARRYNVASLPTSIFIRTDGVIVQIYPGAIPLPLMERGLERALEPS